MKHYPLRKKIRLPFSTYKKGYAFFITLSTYERHPWFRYHPDLREVAVKLIQDNTNSTTIELYAWCIMPDHVHFLGQGKKLIDFIRLFKGKMTPYARCFDPDRRLWQRSFFDHALRKEESLGNTACYIWENPARAEIVKNPAHYKWSGSEVWTHWRSLYK